ncbi:MAG TPA: GrpB family protein [Opitutaceae bacterium]
MDNPNKEPDGRMRRDAYRLRLREDLISLRIQYLRRGRPTEEDHRALARIHEQVMASLAALLGRHAPGAAPAGSSPGGLDDAAVEVVAYDPSWRQRFESEAADISQALGSPVLAVHHIGSTAIPGMPAKPIVDMAVAAEPSTFASMLPAYVAGLGRLGYEYCGDWGHHGGHYFARNSGRQRVSGVQLHPADSADLADVIRFRDAARTDPGLFRDYADLKVALARAFDCDRGLYLWHKGHWLNDRLLADREPSTWGTLFLRAQYPTLIQLGLRGMMSKLRPSFTGKGLHPMAIRGRRPVLSQA